MYRSVRLGCLLANLRTSFRVRDGHFWILRVLRTLELIISAGRCLKGLLDKFNS